jgi:hypothetical protein
MTDGKKMVHALKKMSYAIDLMILFLMSLFLINLPKNLAKSPSTKNPTKIIVGLISFIRYFLESVSN